MDKVLERLKSEFVSEESRYAYADSTANAFLAGQIKALREDRGMTQEKLAELVGTQQSGISRWQNSGFSSCRVETLRKFAKAFGVRLWITFEEFGSLPEDVRGFTKGRLAPRKFEDDLAFKEPAPEPMTEADSFVEDVYASAHNPPWGTMSLALAGPSDKSLNRKDYNFYLPDYYKSFKASGLGALAQAQTPKRPELPDPYNGLRLVPNPPQSHEAENPIMEGKAA